MDALHCHNFRDGDSSPHWEGPLAFPGSPSGQVDDVVMRLLQPLREQGVGVVLVTEHGKVHGVVAVRAGSSGQHCGTNGPLSSPGHP